MKRFYLLDYIKNNKDIDSEIYDMLKYELDQHIYFYGNQFLYPKEKALITTQNCNKYIKKNIKRLILLIKLFLINNKLKQSNKTVISSAYFGLNKELEKIGYDTYHPCYGYVKKTEKMLGNSNILTKSQYITNKLTYGKFVDIIDNKFIKKIQEFKDCLKKYYSENNIDALIVANDMTFYDKLAIKIFKKINKPTFVFLHGLPARYNGIDDNRADYLIVWGNKIKEYYVEYGVDPKKIFVSGHPYYKDYNSKELQFDLNNILVLTKVMNGAQHGNNCILSDRGNLILYLYSIQNVLTKLGVKSVRLRLHPADNPKWYIKYINTDFYKLDKCGLKDSINKSSLIIGPSSTVFLESIYYGVNYLVYEPVINNLDLINFKLVPPFDDTNKKVPVAKDEDELLMLLNNKTKVDATVFNDYIKTPFDISFIKDLI